MTFIRQASEVSHLNLLRGHELFVPKKVRTVAERIHDEHFPDTELKPCPFCGGKAEQDSSSGSNEVDCFECGAYTWGATPREAIACWNRRTPTATEDE